MFCIFSTRFTKAGGNRPGDGDVVHPPPEESAVGDHKAASRPALSFTEPDDGRSFVDILRGAGRGGVGGPALGRRSSGRA